MALRSALVSALVLFGLGGCPAPPDQGEVAVPELDEDAFATWVQPVVRDTCSSIDCHGNARRPLRLYAIWGLRLSADLRGEPASQEERALNALAFAGLDPMTPAEDNLAILKPLATSAGGTSHEGGIIFASREAAGFVCLRSWLAGELTASADAQAACQEAAVDIPAP